MNKQILVIDDNDYITTTLKIAIEKEGYIVSTSNSGEDALKWLNSNVANLVITDINMPGLNGFEVIEKIQADPKNQSVPILVLTTQHYSKQKAKEMGVLGFLTKPFSTRKLISTINKILR